MMMTTVAPMMNHVMRMGKHAWLFGIGKNSTSVLMALPCFAWLRLLSVPKKKRTRRTRTELNEIEKQR